MDETEKAGIDSGTGAGTDTGVDSASSAGSEDNTDWKALYEKEHDRAENLKTAFSQKKEFVKAGVAEVVNEDDDKPITRADLARVVAETVVPVIAQNKVDAELERKVTDPEKRKLVRLYYETRVRQMGTSDDAIRNDIDAAIAIADAQKLRKTAAEITRKSNMQSSPSLSGSESDRGLEPKNHKFSLEQEAALTNKAKLLGMDPKKFIEQTWRNQSRG